MNRNLFLFLGIFLFANNLFAQDELYSGSWYPPTRSGEGFVVQILDDSRALVTWFTYRPGTGPAAQAWMIGLGTLDGTTILIDEMLITRGGIFGEEFDPDLVIREFWGTLQIEFQDCSHGTATYSGPEGWGSGTQDIVRLTELDDLTCNPDPDEPANRFVSGRSGSFFDPSHDGEGWMVQMLSDGQVVLYWFTYDRLGQQRWFVGAGRMDGANFWIEDVFTTSGTFFGADFDPEDVVRERWGSLGVVHNSCHLGTLGYNSVLPEFGTGTLVYDRLANLLGVSCEPPVPEIPLAGGTWRMASSFPDQAPSESASLGIGDWSYVAGGFGGLSRFRRYNAVTGQWQDLAAMPEERHHLSMATDGNSIYIFGGMSGPNFVERSNLWRYDLETNVWEELPDMPRVKGAGAAVYLHGKFYILGGATPWLGLYEPVSGVWQVMPDSPLGAGDHSQAVIFEGEIWKIGGRKEVGGTVGNVEIWNPVTETWRPGPTMKRVRSGFAADIVQGQIIVAGGEVFPSGFGNSPTIELTTEVFAPGASEWVVAPSLITGVHGVMGSSVNGEFIVSGGSVIPGSVTGRFESIQVYSPAPIITEPPE